MNNKSLSKGNKIYFTDRFWIKCLLVNVCVFPYVVVPSYILCSCVLQYQLRNRHISIQHHVEYNWATQQHKLQTHIPKQAAVSPPAWPRMPGHQHSACRTAHGHFPSSATRQETGWNEGDITCGHIRWNKGTQHVTVVGETSHHI